MFKENNPLMHDDCVQSYRVTFKRAVVLFDFKMKDLKPSCLIDTRIGEIFLFVEKCRAQRSLLLLRLLRVDVLNIPRR